MFTKRRGSIIFFLALIILITPQIYAISTTPSSFEIGYSPGSFQEFQSQVWGINDLNISFNSLLSEKGEILSISKDSQNVFTVKWGFEMPETLAPGYYDPLILFKESPPERKYGEQPTGLSAVAAIGVPVRFYVPFPEKYLRLTNFEWNQEIARGGTLFFKAELKSMGKETINQVTGTAKISGYGSDYYAPFTTAKNVQLGETIELLGEWSPQADLPLGNYNLVSEFDYDGTKLTSPEYYLTYGAKVIKITSLSPLTLFAGKVSSMNLKVKNFWSEELDFSIIAKAYNANNTLVKESISADYSVGANSETEAQFYIDTAGWEIGNYTLETSLNYEGEPSVKEFTIAVNAPLIQPRQEFPGAVNIVLLVMVMVLALVIIGYGLVKYFRNKNKKTKK